MGWMGQGVMGWISREINEIPKSKLRVLSFSCVRIYEPLGLAARNFYQFNDATIGYTMKLTSII